MNLAPWSVILLLSLGSAVASFARGVTDPADWAQFGGPLNNGASPEKGLLRQWPGDGPRVLWRAKLKQGWGGVSVAGNDVCLGWSEQANGTEETIACFSAVDGKERWHFTYPVGPYWEKNVGWPRGGFRTSPVITDRYVITLGVLGHLFCLDRQTGAVIWKKNLWDEYQQGEKGYCFSPVVVGDMLVLWHGDAAAPINNLSHRIVLCRGLKLQTGEQVWIFSEPHREPARMGEGQTPTIADFGGESCALVSANCQLKAIRVSDGKQVWAFEVVKQDARGTTIPSPLVVGNFIMNVPDLDVASLTEVDRDHLERPARIVWKKDLNIFTAIHAFRGHNGFLYGFTGEIEGGSEEAASDSKVNLVCLEMATGKVMWSKAGFKTGVSLIEADGLLFVRDYQTLRLVEAAPDSYRQLGQVHTHNVRKASQNLTDFVLPILSHGRLYVRTPTELICYEVAEGA